MTDYTAMSDGAAYLACGADASNWADWFCQCNPDGAPDRELMVTWFANAMMAMHDHMRPDLAPVVLPDGSAFCPG